MRDYIIFVIVFFVTVILGRFTLTFCSFIITNRYDKTMQILIAYRAIGIMHFRNDHFVKSLLEAAPSDSNPTHGDYTEDI